MSEQQRSTYVWDVPVRLFHWGVVAAVGVSWYSAEQGVSGWQAHLWSGYVLLTLVLFRVLWGVWGSETARFSDFLTGPRTLMRYLRHWWQVAPSRSHNPLGGWAVVVLLLLLLAQGVTGLFATDDILYSGPLADWVSGDLQRAMTRMHATLFDLLVVLIVLHVLAIAVYRLARGERLLTAMITGRKRDGFAQPWIAPLGRAALLAAAAAGLLALAVLTAP
ncbi:MAG: cytochrome b/b6 domain-containing protein [Halorhodospira sp.]